MRVLKGQIRNGGARSVFNAINAGGKQVYKTLGFLRDDVKLGTDSTISFNLIATNGAAAPAITANRLQVVDGFIATKISIAIFRVATAADTALGYLHSFCNPYVFTAAQAANFASFYNGQVQILKNAIQVVPAIDMYSFYDAGTSQGGTSVSTVVATGAIPADEFGANTSFISITPEFEFSGADNVQVKITLPKATDLTGVGYDTYASLRVRGFLVQNGSFVGRKNRTGGKQGKFSR